MNESFRREMNLLGRKRIPFLFIIDFESVKPIILPVDETSKNDILFSIDGIKNYDLQPLIKPEYILRKHPVDFIHYKKSFDLVMKNLLYGNSFLTNFTCQTEISTNISMEEIFFLSRAPFKLQVKNEFVVFSPELFVRTQGRKISSFPMKGTIDASLPDAETLLLNDPKEIAEHHTIVDLIRNDLSMIAEKVKVEKFMYLDEVKSRDKDLLQVSSEISGLLPVNYQEYLGDLISELLPAGSVSGAPKMKTLEIIQESEGCPRGYYTGIFGIFDGYNLTSAVMIRYIENTGGKMIYRSGGGVTVYSDPRKEYQEMIDKIYLPI